MNRFIARLAAAALAAGVTIVELVCASLLADSALAPGGSLLLMPRVVVTPAAPEEGPDDGASRAQAPTSKPLPRT